VCGHSLSGSKTVAKMSWMMLAGPATFRIGATLAPRRLVPCCSARMRLLLTVACMLLLASCCLLLLACCSCFARVLRYVPVPAARMLSSCGARCVSTAIRNNSCNNKEHHEHIYTAKTRNNSCNIG
jgi:hypothetical protein